jgi:hypothetical protein
MAPKIPPDKRPPRAGTLPNAGIANGKATSQAQSPPSEIDRLKSLVGRGRAPVIDQAGWAVPTGRCDRTRDVQLGKLHVD